MEKKRVVLFGPIGDFGGRELEAGFIAKILSKDFKVLLCSTGFISSESQVFDFVEKNRVTSFRSFLYSNFFLIKLSSFISYLRNGKEYEPAFYAKNAINKRFLNTEKKIEKYCLELLHRADIVFICAQISSSYLKLIVEIAYSIQKPVVFRTTGRINGAIYKGNSKFEWLYKVNLYVNHSTINSMELSYISNYNYTIIDQCAFQEEDFLKLKPLAKKIRKFLIYARLVESKNIALVIHAFKQAKNTEDELMIIGSGPELKKLKAIASGDKSIIFKGFVPHKNIVQYMAMVDCVIISPYEQETGPLTGIEAMASGRIIISSRTGAMSERLSELGFWYKTSKELTCQIQKVKKLSAENVQSISTQIREKYLNSYKKNIIKEKYLEAISKLLTENR